MDALNVEIANSVIGGRLEGNAFVQGILIQCLRRLNKDARGVSAVGRPAECTETERRLVQGAALQFAIAGGNRDLAVSLGQHITPPKILLEDLPQFSLPNPCLSLRLAATEQFQENLRLVDQRFMRKPTATSRRMFLGIDHTYLDRSLNQTKVQGEAGLVGAPWGPLVHPPEAREFMSFEHLPPDAATTPRAPLMLECVLWHPMALKQQCLSIASLPMSLAATASSTGEKDRNHGKRVPGTSWDCILF